MRAEDDRFQVAQQQVVVGEDRRVRHQRHLGVDEAGGPQKGVRPGDVGEVPHVRHVVDQVVDGADDVRDVPVPTAFEDELAAGGQDGREVVEQRAMVGYPVEGGHAEDRVDQAGRAG